MRSLMVIVLFGFLLVSGCDNYAEENTQLKQMLKDNEHKILELNKSIEYMKSGKEKLENEDDNLTLWELLEKPNAERNNYIKSFENNCSGSVSISDYDEFIIPLIRIFLNPFDHEYAYYLQPRSINEYDKKILLPEYRCSGFKKDGNEVEKDFKFLDYYLKLNTKRKIKLDQPKVVREYYTKNVTKEEFDTLIIYLNQDELHMTLYNNGKIMETYQFFPKYYKEMFKEVSDLRAKLLELPCEGRPDC